MREGEGQLRIADLRLGQEPGYSFEFQLDPAWVPKGPVTPAVRIGRRNDPETALPWLRARLRGEDLPPLSDILAQRAPQRTPIASPPLSIDTPLPQSTLPRLP